MAIAWTLARANGDTRTFEEWGIRGAIDRRIALSRGTVDLNFGRSDLLTSLPFDSDESLLIAADGNPYFRGRVIAEKRGAYGSNETAVITLADPWWYLEKIIYMQFIGVVSNPNANPAPADPGGLQISDFPIIAKLSSYVVLGQNPTGSLIDGRGNILAAINYAISKGAPIQLGTIDDGRLIPLEEVHDLTCAEMILKCLRWMPEMSAWFDYSVNPPAINIRSRANRTLLSLDVNDKAMRKAEINPRHDLVLTGVLINYLRRHQRDNFEFITLDPESAGPTPIGVGALDVTIELYGSYIYQAPAGAGGSVPPALIIPQEAAPAGLALALYNAYKDLSFEGTVNFLAGNVATLYLGRTLSILDGAPAWATSTMDIQQATIDLFALDDADAEHYAVELSVGPARQLGPTDLVGLVRKGRTQPPPLLGGPTSGGGGPKLPTWNYGNPKVPAATQHADVTLEYSYWQDAGFPNSWGPSDGQHAHIHQTFISDPVLDDVNAGTINDGQIHEIRGIRFLVVRKYYPTSSPPPALPVLDVYIDDYFDTSGHRK